MYAALHGESQCFLTASTLGAFIKDVCPSQGEGVSNNVDKSRQGEGGRGFSCKWTSFLVWSLEERIVQYACLFKELLFLHRFCSSLIFFQFSVHTDRGGGCQAKSGQGREGAENWQKCVDTLYAGPLQIFNNFTLYGVCKQFRLSTWTNSNKFQLE